MTEYKDTSLATLPDWYLEWCWDEKPLQEYWRAEWSDGVTTFSHVHIGDRFTLSKYKQFGVICDKVLVLQGNDPDTYEYQIGGDIGGHWYRPRHNQLADGFFLWIPTIEQLLQVGGYHEKAADLACYIGNRSDPRAIITEFLKTAEEGYDAYHEGDIAAAQLFMRQTAQMNKLLKLSGISIDEADDPEKALGRPPEDAESKFFHIRLDGKPWKKVHGETGEWSDFT